MVIERKILCELENHIGDLIPLKGLSIRIEAQRYEEKTCLNMLTFWHDLGFERPV